MNGLPNELSLIVDLVELDRPWEGGLPVIHEALHRSVIEGIARGPFSIGADIVDYGGVRYKKVHDESEISESGARRELHYEKISGRPVLGGNNVLVSVDLLEDLKGYRIGFTNVWDGLLKRDEHARGSDPNYLSVPEWNERYGKNDDVLYASEEGLRLMRELGFNWFRSEVLHPEGYGGVEIGSGFESRVYGVELEERECVVKIWNPEPIARANEETPKLMNFLPINYTEKFGKTRVIADVLQEVSYVRPFRTFNLVDSPIEYVAGRRYIVEQKIQGYSLGSLVDAIGGDDGDLDTSVIDFARGWLPRFEGEMNELADLFFIASHAKSPWFGEIPTRDLTPTRRILRETDFYTGNWIVVGQHIEGGKLDLVLIDQCSPRPGMCVRASDQEAGFASERYETTPNAQTSSNATNTPTSPPHK